MKTSKLQIAMIRHSDLAALFLCFLCLSPILYDLSLKANDRLFQPYTLGNEESQAMQWILDNYNMSDLLFLSLPPGWGANEADPDYVRWIVYMLKPYQNNVEIYLGSIFDLINGLPSYQIPNLPAYQGKPSFKWPLDKIIVTISTSYAHTFYKFDDIEKLLFTEVHKNVYQLKGDINSETLKDLAAIYREEFVNKSQLTITSLPSDLVSWHKVGGCINADSSGIHFFPNGTKVTSDGEPYMYADFYYDFDLQQEWYMALNLSISGGKFGVNLWNGSEKTGWLWNLESEKWQYRLIHLNPLVRNGNTLTRLSIVLIKENVSVFTNSVFLTIFELP